ncbi:hypothetical protein HBI56_074420 [Parastagonospora nodorum]|uniref:Uncharacterized protein n=1 Tax=Phaeosphaeria nodorum (strain SN15 / ATCC MYA-4574 / FGSC 10173) TaxID=321614 RepID=A0A7U2EXC2_PHANO|nr:hypothetical protein HBH56_170560 [Parastagonospora nodorum]QRC94462.1 hypothetical protein JI435_405870 [Parastagonospora nodorum SN15]KAH3928260.1 hypothetical protein HBH54_139120 [Parastagonospora nodorum]KAH3945455.1 hypothetical protein HBH53_144470 [Parastagonospora nodorum]KAH3983706.1 hypothetical protein HBH52_059750 [Parastagonospora nodorum]
MTTTHDSPLTAQTTQHSTRLAQTSNFATQPLIPSLRICSLKGVMPVCVRLRRGPS